MEELARVLQRRVQRAHMEGVDGGPIRLLELDPPQQPNECVYKGVDVGVRAAVERAEGRGPGERRVDPARARLVRRKDARRVERRHKVGGRGVGRREHARQQLVELGGEGVQAVDVPHDLVFLANELVDFVDADGRTRLEVLEGRGLALEEPGVGGGEAGGATSESEGGDFHQGG